MCLDQFFFERLGFEGNTDRYYDVENSNIHHVFDSRKVRAVLLKETNGLVDKRAGEVACDLQLTKDMRCNWACLLAGNPAHTVCVVHGDGEHGRHCHRTGANTN